MRCRPQVLREDWFFSPKPRLLSAVWFLVSGQGATGVGKGSGKEPGTSLSSLHHLLVFAPFSPPGSWGLSWPVLSKDGVLWLGLAPSHLPTKDLNKGTCKSHLSLFFIPAVQPVCAS